MSLIQDAQRFPVTAVMIVGAVAAVLADASGRSIEHLMLVPGLALSEPWRLVTCILPHGGAFHLLFNVYWIWMLGRVIESRMGSPVTAVLTVLCAIAASGLEAAMMHSAVGLSGIVYGFAFYAYARGKTDPRFYGVIDARLIRFFLGWFFLCIALTELGVIGVANAAHFGGGLMGFACGMRRRWVAPVVLGAVVAAMAFSSTQPVPTHMLRRGADQDLQDGKLGPAIEAYERLIEGGDMRAGTWKNYGIALQDSDRVEEALEAWGLAIELDPQIFTPEHRKRIQLELQGRPRRSETPGAGAPGPRTRGADVPDHGTRGDGSSESSPRGDR
ncbi:rhomboid family intramembrane serine protease [Planctomycetota bacterium]|nr:rhomboid family intramembrane serine protease [Planctomycetota bacterium]